MTGPITPYQPISGPFVWTGPEMTQRDDWIHVLSGDEIAEIDAAIDAVQARGLGSWRSGRRTFRCPRWGR